LLLLLLLQATRVTASPVLPHPAIRHLVKQQQKTAASSACPHQRWVRGSYAVSACHALRLMHIMEVDVLASRAA
jgi:hypothetical protein